MVRSDFTRSLELVAPVHNTGVELSEKEAEKMPLGIQAGRKSKSRGPVENTEVGTSVRIHSSRPELFGCDKKKQEVA